MRRRHTVGDVQVFDNGRTVDVRRRFVVARVNADRWIADCPDCNGAELVAPGVDFICASEYPGIVHRDARIGAETRRQAEREGRVYRVEFPREKEAIERTLQRRPERDWRHWEPGTGVQELIDAEPSLHHSWTAPRTWVTGELVSAAIGNTHWRDNLLETAPAKVTAAGDMLYASAANTLALLAKQTNGQVLTLSAGLPSWGWLPIDTDTNNNIQSTTVEVTVYSKSITGGTLSSGHMLLVACIGEFQAGPVNDTFTFRFNFGGSTMATLAHVESGGAARKGFLWLTLFECSGASSERIRGMLMIGAENTDTAGAVYHLTGSASAALASDQTLALTIQQSEGQGTFTEEAALIYNLGNL